MNNTNVLSTDGATSVPGGSDKGRTRRRWSRRVAIVVAVTVALCGVGYLANHDPSPVGHWRSEEGREAYEQAYLEALGRMPTPTGQWDIATDWGTTRVYRWDTPETRGRTPLVLYPGWTSGNPMWSENLPGLIQAAPVYTVDAIGDAGLSTQTRPLATNTDQAEWMDQVLARLDLPRVHLMGHSFGGYLAANYAVRKPERVATLTLIDPPLVVSTLPVKVIVKSIPAALPALPQSWRDNLLEDIGGGKPDPADPVARMISLAVTHYAPKKPTPEALTDDQLRSLRMPVFLGLAGRSFLDHAETGERRARATIPAVTVRVWPDATHSLPMERKDEVDAAVLTFIGQH